VQKYTPTAFSDDNVGFKDFIYEESTQFLIKLINYWNLSRNQVCQNVFKPDMFQNLKKV
jgi:hypothetical protein